jgi:probable dihydroxyacetone kinase regulator
MEHSITTLNTKKMLAASLKRIVSNKPFSKVSVSEIVQDCGVNRKTFYYHFTDVYGLLKWTLEQEAITVVAQFDLISEYEEVVCFVMNYVEENNPFLKNVYNSMGRDTLKQVFFQDFVQIIENLIRQGEKLKEVQISDDYRRFLSTFYTEALVGILVDWIVSYPNRNRQQTIQYLRRVLRASILHAISDEP